MKIAIIIHNVAESDLIDELLDKLEIKNFTRIPKAIGKNIAADPVFDDRVWPGYYTITIIEDTLNKIERIRAEVKNIKEYLKIPDLKYYEVEADNFI